MGLIFEVCCDSVESALAAQNGGAARIELCSSLAEGGLTPSHGSIKAVRALVSLPLYVIIRPRGGDFLYTQAEIQVMMEDILAAAGLGAQGAVFGVLTADGRVDEELLMKLVSLSQTLSLDVTFHRAFDLAISPSEALEALVRCGVPRVLTSGQRDSALSGLPLLSALNAQAGGRIALMAGGGISEDNIASIIQCSGIQEVHGSARVRACSKMQFNRQLSLSSTGTTSEDTWVTDSAKVAAIITAAASVIDVPHTIPPHLSLHPHAAAPYIYPHQLSPFSAAPGLPGTAPTAMPPPAGLSLYPYMGIPPGQGGYPPQSLVSAGVPAGVPHPMYPLGLAGERPDLHPLLPGPVPVSAARPPSPPPHTSATPAVVASEGAPLSTGGKICRFFFSSQGWCMKGASCRFLHTRPASHYEPTSQPAASHSQPTADASTLPSPVGVPSGATVASADFTGRSTELAATSVSQRMLPSPEAVVWGVGTNPNAAASGPQTWSGPAKDASQHAADVEQTLPVDAPRDESNPKGTQNHKVGGAAAVIGVDSDLPLVALGLEACNQTEGSVVPARAVDRRITPPPDLIAGSPMPSCAADFAPSSNQGAGSAMPARTAESKLTPPSDSGSGSALPARAAQSEVVLASDKGAGSAPPARAATHGDKATSAVTPIEHTQEAASTEQALPQRSRRRQRHSQGGSSEVADHKQRPRQPLKLQPSELEPEPQPTQSARTQPRQQAQNLPHPPPPQLRPQPQLPVQDQASQRVGPGGRRGGPASKAAQSEAARQSRGGLAEGQPAKTLSASAGGAGGASRPEGDARLTKAAEVTEAQMQLGARPAAAGQPGGSEGAPKERSEAGAAPQRGESSRGARRGAANGAVVARGESGRQSGSREASIAGDRDSSAGHETRGSVEDAAAGPPPGRSRGFRKRRKQKDGKENPQRQGQAVAGAAVPARVAHHAPGRIPGTAATPEDAPISPGHTGGSPRPAQAAAQTLAGANEVPQASVEVAGGTKAVPLWDGKSKNRAVFVHGDHRVYYSGDRVKVFYPNGQAQSYSSKSRAGSSGS
ncbi:hypothetical protein CYMTET_16886 [Cymbomonas tetramitiformis]|uniref:Copper homeostasis protein cutC homolog n=1 Tax=Cymbomonas tetramitiformis TaxID=36881 RepID=A0AAE0GBP5_9CHLO|nr:hypothetical protein CYMTET_16886 [Cymbomonas tetramitiformis]